jgi:Tfp pilus assembly protein PilF
VSQALFVAATGLCLAACSMTAKSANPSAAAPSIAAAPSGSEALAMGPAAPPPLGVPPVSEAGLLGSDPYDALALGKKQYRANNFGLAEKYFRRAVETHPRDAEAWVGLAASYDRLRRFDLADRAYAEAVHIVGPTPEILNNEGFSYMLRGDYAKARVKLAEAHRIEPGNRYVANNLRLLNASVTSGKAIE